MTKKFRQTDSGRSKKIAGPPPFFHTTVNGRGLGINSLRTLGLLRRNERLLGIQFPSTEMDLAGAAFLAKEIDTTSRRLQLGNYRITDRTAMNHYWAGSPRAMVEGAGLRETHLVP